MPVELWFGRDSNIALEPDFLIRVRELLQLPQHAQLELAGIQADSKGGCSIEYAIAIPIQLCGREYGIADGVVVDERSTAKLSFDGTGKFISSSFDGTDERHLKLVRDQVRKLAASDQIAPTRPEATSGSKPWYLEKDSQGVRRLKRAQMA